MQDFGIDCAFKTKTYNQTAIKSTQTTKLWKSLQKFFSPQTFKFTHLATLCWYRARTVLSMALMLSNSLSFTSTLVMYSFKIGNLIVPFFCTRLSRSASFCLQASACFSIQRYSCKALQKSKKLVHTTKSSAKYDTITISSNKNSLNVELIFLKKCFHGIK